MEKVSGGVICSGAIVEDTLVRPVEAPAWGTTTVVETIERQIGGNGANTSIALATIGIPVRLMGTVGRDAAGRFVLDTLQRAGVDTGGVTQSDLPTPATIVLVNGAGDRKFLHCHGAGATALADGIEFGAELLAGMQHYHLASLFILPAFRPHAAGVLARARAAGLTTSLDTNWDPEGAWMRDLGPCLRDLDYLFVNEDEARMLTGSEEPRAAAEVLLRHGVRTAVLKLGARGCAVYTADREILSAAFQVVAHDTTGAGDCFAAGFLAAVLRGASPADAARFANAVGALAVEQVGATSGVRSFDDVERWMAGRE